MTALAPVAPLRHLREPVPVDFPSEALVRETKDSLLLRTALFQMLAHALGGRSIIGSDQLVYGDASDARKCLAPDLFVKLGGPDESFDSWKVWKRGAPEFALELLSDSDAPNLDEKLARYAALGVKELVAYDVRTRSLRVWDRLQGDLMERAVDGRSTPCGTLDLHLVRIADERGIAFAEDAEGTRLLLSRDAARAQEESARAARFRAKLVAAGLDPDD